MTVAECKELMRINTSAAFFLSIEFRRTGYLVYASSIRPLWNLPNKLPRLSRVQPDAEQLVAVS